jgi:flagellar assembly factor FliW
MTPPAGATLSPPALLRAPMAASAEGAPAPSPVHLLAFAEPLPGFPAHRDYVLVPADATRRLFWLQSMAPEGPRFLAVAAGAYFPEYAPALPGAALAELGLPDAGAAEVFCLVTVPGGDVASATANLRAPVLVNRDTHRARQVVLTDGLHPIRRPLRR